MLTFHSVDSDDNKVIFNNDYVREDNRIIFKDKSTENTDIILTINDDLSLVFERKGSINMLLPLALGEKKAGYYKNSNGLEFDLNVKTLFLEIKNNKISVEYELYVMDVVQTHKIWILLH